MRRRPGPEAENAKNREDCERVYGFHFLFIIPIPLLPFQSHFPNRLKANLFRFLSSCPTKSVQKFTMPRTRHFGAAKWRSLKQGAGELTIIVKNYESEFHEVKAGAYWRQQSIDPNHLMVFFPITGLRSSPDRS